MKTSRFFSILILLVFLGGVQTAMAQGPAFNSSVLAGANVDSPTALQFGPDNRLYIAQRNGLLKVLTVVRSGPGAYRVIASETIDLIQNIPNYNDDGTLFVGPDAHPERQVTGMIVAGDSDHPVIYVTSSDYRNSYHVDFHINNHTGVDTNSGIVSRLTWDGSTWQKLDLVRGLPRSGNDHSTNGLALDQAHHILFVGQGGNTNMGAPISYIDSVPEYAYSAAILSVDLAAIGEHTYDLPTLDDPNRPGNPDENDPFGGDRGLNQAVVQPGSPVQIYAPGYRNPYDLVLTADGRLYASNNGPNVAWGSPPIDCRNAINDAVLPTMPASLQLVTPGHYAGHPNPTRGSLLNTFGGQSPIAVADPQQCQFIEPKDTGALALWDTGLVGMAEYTASNFGGAMTGDLLVATWNSNSIDRIHLDPSGTKALQVEPIFNNFGQWTIDVTAQNDRQIFPGTVWVSIFDTDPIHVFEPADYDGAAPQQIAGGVYSTTLDDDKDGYSNADEMDNGTLTYSAASVPADFDKDGLSDLNDPDDDNDGIADVNDAFALDASNGQSTTLPLTYTWNTGNPGTGLLGLGFTGLMTNGKTNYRDQFDSKNIIAGAAQGKLTIGLVPPGDAFQGNGQQYAFQFGFKPDGAYTVHSRVIAPFFDGKAPQHDQALGIFIGTGDQDNYLKLTLNADGLQVLTEEGGKMTSAVYAPPNLLQNDAVDLYLSVDPQTGIQASYAADGGSAQRLGAPVRPAWLASMVTPAVGIISTSDNAEPFAATWDFLEVLPGSTSPATATLAPESAQQVIPDQSATCGLHPAAPSPIPRFESSGRPLGGKLYLIGGFTGELLGLSRVDAYDPATDSWTQLADLPEPLSHMGIVADDETKTIWVAGGFVGDHPGKATADVWIYSVESNSWRAGPSLPFPVAGGALVQLGRTLHYVGGVLGDRNSGAETHFTLDMDQGTAWESVLAPLVPARNHLSAVALDGKILVMGGEYRHDTDAQDIPLVTLYDPTTNSWQPLAELPEPRSHFESAAFVLGDEVIVIGGRAPGENNSQDMLAYNPATNTWRKFGQLSAARVGAVAAMIDGQLIVATGGPVYNQATGTLWVGDPLNPCQPVAGLAVANVATAFVGSVVRFTASQSAGTDVSYSWDFGDGSDRVTTRQPTVAHLYSQSTTYLVSVTASNPVGEQTTISRVHITAPPTNTAEALIRIETPPVDHSSTYDSGSFTIANASTGDQKITHVRYDIGTALMAGVVFDVNGKVGDSVSKTLTVDSDTGTGLVGFQLTETTVDLTFNDFEPGDGLGFSIDVDPSSIKGLPPPGPNDSGGVDGLELAGTTVTVTFNDGTERTTQLVPIPQSLTGSQNITRVQAEPPTLQLPGQAADRSTLSAGDHVIEISGAPRAQVSVLIAEGQLYGVSSDDPFALNNIDSAREETIALDASGHGQISVAVTPGVITVIAATTLDADGGMSLLSNRLLLRAS